VTLGADGYFTFKADTLLPCGVYMFVLKPDNSFIQILLPDTDQDFTISTDAKMPFSNENKGTEDNQIFYEYLGYLGKMRVDADTIRAQMERLKDNPADSLRLIQKSGELDKLVKKYQRELIAKHPGTLTAKIIKSSTEPEIPEFEGKDDKEIQLKKYFWYRAHYFDNMIFQTPACCAARYCTRRSINISIKLSRNTPIVSTLPWMK
jgi:hypothetical protein